MEKTTVIFRRGKTNWLAGGHWTAGERFSKRPGSLKKLAIAEGFDPARTSAVWLPDEQQIGWFTFDGKPVKGLPLAALAARRLGVGQWPWQGLFKLDDDLWWLVVTDSAGALHPSWDIIGPEEWVMQSMHDRVAELATIPHQERIEDPEAAWEWLLGDAAVIRSLPSVKSVTGVQAAAQKTALVMVPLILLLAGGGAGLTWWEKRQALLAQEKARQSLLAQQRDQQAQTAAQLAQEKALMAQIEQTWAQTPKPWTKTPSWGDVMAACQVGPVTQDGWLLTTVQCTLQGDSLQIQRTWNRLPFATVLNAPQGVIDPQGQTVVSQQSVALPTPQPGQAAVNGEQVGRWWLGMTQKWANVLAIKAEPLQPFRPPFPPNTPPQIQQKMTPPVLWQQGKVTITGAINPKPLWTVLSATGYLPQSVAINLKGARMQWTLEGTQYVNP